MSGQKVAAAAEPTFSLTHTPQTTSMPPPPLFANSVPPRFLLKPALLEALLPESPESLKEYLKPPQQPTTHTTPSLDFPHFVTLIDKAITTLSSAIESLNSLCPPDYNKLKTDPEYRIQYIKDKNLRAVLCVADAIALFNTLTCPPKVTHSNLKRGSATKDLDLPESPTVYPANVIVAIAQNASPTPSTAPTPPETPHRRQTQTPSRSSSRRTTNPSSPTHHSLHTSTSQKHPYTALIASLNSPHPSFDITLPPTSRARYHFQRALIYSWLPWKDERVQEDLGKCLKLDPKNCFEAWNLMGEWYCRIGSSGDGTGGGGSVKDYWALGKECFEKGLKVFFGLTFDLKDLHKSLVAYNNAAADPKMENDADLYGNRASIHQYTESYQLALLDFDKSAKCDPLQSGVDSWPKMVHLKGLLGAVAKSVDVCQRNVDLTSASGSLTAGKSRFQMPFKKLSPMKDGVSASGVLVDESVSFFKRDDVHVGKYLKVEVVCCLSDGLPRTFVAKDVKGRCMGVSVFNITIPIQVGDELIVSSPCVFRVKVDFEECKVDYINLRIDRPWLLSVNGKIVGKLSIALTEARFENL
ncbi:UNVERIFIED_CONTAM: Tetratricopeptide repeat protein 5 [Siphonaria sp. JEL0065]|nr:Tetratricopeptide repeat protein 5 [Siphonaria sp. JEL0065]